ncbi:MAG TPA: Smr/MutS family protein [Thermodesulfobacteriota bacterium]|nr:Smr/MutS family protein [Thermodesulfobacteriota bacterium]
MNDYFDPDKPVHIPLEDTLDLHSFLPKEVPALLEEYLAECVKAGIVDVRIIHGKGKGFLREKVHSLLRKSLLVDSFHLADETGGSWGATIVRLRKS